MFEHLSDRNDVVQIVSVYDARTRLLRQAIPIYSRPIKFIRRGLTSPQLTATSPIRKLGVQRMKPPADPISLVKTRNGLQVSRESGRKPARTAVGGLPGDA